MLFLLFDTYFENLQVFLDLFSKPPDLHVTGVGRSEICLPVFEEDEETLASKSITAKEEKPQEAVFSISERSLTPPV